MITQLVTLVFWPEYPVSKNVWHLSQSHSQNQDSCDCFWVFFSISQHCEQFLRTVCSISGDAAVFYIYIFYWYSNATLTQSCLCTLHAVCLSLTEQRNNNTLPRMNLEHPHVSARAAAKLFNFGYLCSQRRVSNIPLGIPAHRVTFCGACTESKQWEKADVHMARLIWMIDKQPSFC